MHSNIIFIFIYSNKDSSKEDWKKMITGYFNRLKSKPIGNLLYYKLFSYLDFDCTFKIDFINVLADFEKNRNIIYIPSEFTKCEIQYLEEPLLKSESESEYKEILSLSKLTTDIYNYKETSHLLTENHINQLEELIKYKQQDYFFLFVNQLIRIIRKLEYKKINETLLEDASIVYGIKGFSYYINENLITENTIRKEWNDVARISNNYKN